MRRVLKTIGGAQVGAFSPEQGSPAEKAGIEIGDVITAAAGHPIDQVSTLQRVIRGFKPGDVVDLDVMRFGQKKQFKIKLARSPGSADAVAANDEEGGAAPAKRSEGTTRDFDKIGLSVGTVTPDVARRYKLSATRPHRVDDHERVAARACVERGRRDGSDRAGAQSDEARHQDA